MRKLRKCESILRGGGIQGRGHPRLYYVGNIFFMKTGAAGPGTAILCHGEAGRLPAAYRVLLGVRTEAPPS
jgi:hypothetical protein